jgi:hypothetical protein
MQRSIVGQARPAALLRHQVAPRQRDVINVGIPGAQPASLGQGSTYIHATGYSRLLRRSTAQPPRHRWAVEPSVTREASAKRTRA